jgi:phosphosulfolactate synthase
MNYNLAQIPERTEKPRQKGLTMVMDKGLSLRQVEDFQRWERRIRTLLN